VVLRRKGIPILSIGHKYKACLFSLFLMGMNARLVGNPVNEVRYSGEAHASTESAASGCHEAGDTQEDEVGSFSDG